jgi:hypothetical protein
VSKQSWKYVLVEHTDDWQPLGSGHPQNIERVNLYHFFDTEAEREKATLEAIFGTLDEAKEHQGEADAYLTQLANDGFVRFEGDPGLEWARGVAETGAT